MEKLITQIKSSWFLMAFITSLTIWYANTNSRLTNVEAKVIEQSTLQEQLSELKTTVAVIGSNVDFIKQRVR
jgi:hypothetical protein